MAMEKKDTNSDQKHLFWKGWRRRYFVKTPWWLKKIYSSYTWDIRTNEKVIYLSFDDGPHEYATPFVLDELKKYNAKASFFCIGKNVVALPAVYKRILDEGHTAGNHTYNHLNGWKAADAEYLKDVADAAKYIDSSLFRPPYGRIKSFQAKNVPVVMKDNTAKIIMWDVLSGDFDANITKDECLQNVILNVKKGSIVVFHDSEKAFAHLQFCLPRTLEFLSARGFRFERLLNSRVPGINNKADVAV
jgi:peptidoglycan/xylan/chitin deacetylase (PgdA/CDA1 family)